jgi:hypothetical protein
MMKAVELIGRVDDQHCLQVQVPESLPPGPVRVLPEGNSGQIFTLDSVLACAHLSNHRQ